MFTFIQENIFFVIGSIFLTVLIAVASYISSAKQTGITLQQPMNTLTASSTHASGDPSTAASATTEQSARTISAEKAAPPATKPVRPSIPRLYNDDNE